MARGYLETAVDFVLPSVNSCATFIYVGVENMLAILNLRSQTGNNLVTAALSALS
jgi:hypothetical protein